MKTIYEANDGTQFEDKFECEDYEWKLDHTNLKYIHFYDKNNNELTNMFSEDTYFATEKIIVLTDESIKDLHELADYTGYCCYGDVTEIGEWVFVDNNGNGGFMLKSKDVQA